MRLSLAWHFLRASELLVNMAASLNGERRRIDWPCFAAWAAFLLSLALAGVALGWTFHDAPTSVIY
jgi:hypothetical protein